jgi:hypothetical protein
MLAAVLLGALALSCTKDACSEYAGQERAWALCEQERRGFQGDVETACAGLGPIEASCREEWVRRSVPLPTSTDDLIAACDGASQCLLVVADLRAPEDPVDHIALCQQLPAKTADDCTVHALQRWSLEDASEGDIPRLAELLDSRTLGAAIGMASVCTGKLSCPSEGDLAIPCENESAMLAGEMGRCSKPKAPPR